MRTRVVWLAAFLLLGFVVSGQGYAQEGENLLENGGFETGAMTPWFTYGSATTEVVDELTGAWIPEGPIEGNYCLHVVVPSAGTNSWDTGLQHSNHVFEAGKYYTVSCFLKSREGEFDIRIKPERAADPWEAYNELVTTVTEEWQEYSVTTPVINATVDPASITFHIAFQACDFYIDGVRWYEGDYVPSAFQNNAASEPEPANGATLTDTWTNLGWEPGNSAVTHDVYFGDNFDDVNNGIADTFMGNLSDSYLVVGVGGFAIPEGLVPGTTYYWRVDEVNEADANSPWRGNVWSFFVPPRNAYRPTPANGAKFIDPNVKLSWNSGLKTLIHNVYFGETFEDVNAGTPETSKGAVGNPAYTPGTLEREKTYFWRIDEFDEDRITHKGDIWNFTVARDGGGVRADYYRGMNFQNHVLTRTDSQIDFNWADGDPPDPTIPDDGFSVRWTGEVEAAFTETYTFYTTSDDGVRFWVDGRQLVDNWTDHSSTENRGTIDLIAGNVYTIVMEYYENADNAIAELRWSSPSTPKDLIPQAALSPPLRASSKNPRNGATDVIQTIILEWGAGDHAVSHEVYFGTDAEAVLNADTSSPEYKGTKNLGSESYDPGPLEWDTTYYWRVDEINDLHPDSPWTGSLWSFTTANFILVDNFEDYNDYEPDRIFDSWVDGWNIPTNGSTAGYPDPDFDAGEHFVETTIVHSGSQAMPYFYDNTTAGNSEATLTLTYPTDWTENGVGTLTLWFRGNRASVGSFTEGPAGTYTITAAGTDIENQADEFHYAYKTLSGPGSIIAKVESLDNTNPWAKAGVMIRETLEPGSKHAFACVTPGNGVASQGRTIANDSTFNTNQTGITAPHWVKIERGITGVFTAFHSVDGTNWVRVEGAVGQTIQMGTNVYIGLALTSHNADVTCTAVFSNVQTTGTVGQLWSNQDIGILTNAPEQIYVVLNENAVVYNDNPDAALTEEWTQWDIDLQKFADQGINLTNIGKIGIGFGDRNNPQPGGSGTAYFDDIRLYRPTESQP
jgi:hypothetical protein